MTEPGEVRISELYDASDADLRFPEGFSFFEPYLQYSVKETLEVGGEAYLSRDSQGAVSGIFIYDDSERIGTVYTQSRKVFDYFYQLKPFSLLWSEIKAEQECETYDVYALDLDKLPITHRFSHQISLAEEEDVCDIERYMVAEHPEINRKWVRVALKNGDRCFTIRLDREIAGLAWLSLVNHIGRLHSLNVKPQYRRMGMGLDLLYARLLWLKAKHARSAFSEISRNNYASAGVAAKGHMTVARQVYEYYGKDHGQNLKAEPLAGAARF